MKLLGIIGGIAPASTIEYYRLPVEGWRQRMPGYPPVLINSIDLDRVIGMVSSQAFDSLRERSPIPLISIVEATCSAARTLGLKRPGLIGTRFTMQGSFYPEVFSGHGTA